MIPLRNSSRVEGFPLITYCLIVINILVFITYKYRLGGDPVLLQGMALVPGKVEWCLDNINLLARDPFLLFRLLAKPFLASIFLHADWPHLLGNMWFLLIFGSAVEGRVRPFRYLGFYLFCGAAAGVFHVTNTLGTEREVVDFFGRVVHFGSLEKNIPVIGASGAVAGILGGYFVLFPLSRILVFFPPFFLFHIPALFFLGFWFTYQLFNAYEASQAALETAGYSGVAWWAHVGGFLAGVAALSALRAFSACPEPVVADSVTKEV
jgi:membrane associated rhomboid family serine protease